MSADQAVAAEEDEEDELLTFVDNLDYDGYIKDFGDAQDR